MWPNKKKKKEVNTLKLEGAAEKPARQLIFLMRSSAHFPSLLLTAATSPCPVTTE